MNGFLFMTALLVSGLSQEKSYSISDCNARFGFIAGITPLPLNEALESF